MNNTIEIEKSAVLAAFLNEQCYTKLLLLDDKYIQDDNCKKILSAMKRLKYSEINILRIMNETGIDHKWLADFMNGYTITGLIDVYIQELLEREAKLKLAKVYEGAISAVSKNYESGLVIAEVEEKQNRLKLNHAPIKTVDSDELESVLKIERCLQTGFAPLDDIIKGLYNDELIIIAARPSIGKSALALFIAEKISREYAVMYYTLEMTKQQTIQRMIANNTNIPLWKIREGKLNLFEQDEINKYWEKLKAEKRKFYIHDKIFKLKEILATCESRGKPDIIFVDYLQLIESDQREKRHIQVGDQSRALKELSKKLSIPVVALSQLNRQVETRQDGIPALEDLRESGSLEADADVVIMIHGKKADKERRLIVAKSRSSRTGYVDVNFDGDMMRWT